jgi:hypothetical protein
MLSIPHQLGLFSGCGTQHTATLVDVLPLMQVSHWGRVNVEEHYRLRNAGTTVTPPFSRWNLTQEAMTSDISNSPHIRALFFSLPRSAQYIYTKDDLGNTANVPIPARGSLAVVKTSVLPRYPLLGGWQMEIKLGYSVPLETTVLKQGTRHSVVFLMPPLLDLVCALLEVPGSKVLAQLRCV